MQRNLININSQRLSRLTLVDRPPLSSSSDETEACSSPGLLIFEYLEQDQPHFRLPFYDKAYCSLLRSAYWIFFSVYFVLI